MGPYPLFLWAFNLILEFYPQAFLADALSRECITLLGF
jgi:hypothetical protein